MVKRKYGLLVALAVGLMLSAYFILWVHVETHPTPGGSLNVTAEEWTIAVNASELSCILGHDKNLGYYPFHCRNKDFVLGVSYSPSGLRNVGCNQFSISGNANLYIRPRNNSVAIRRVVFIVENLSDFSIGPVFPKQTGVLYFTINGGKFEVSEVYVPGYDILQTFQVKALKPTWGETVSVSPFIPMDFTINGPVGNGKNAELVYRARVIIRVEYLIRTGYFTSEKRTLQVVIPMTVKFYGLSLCTYGCEP